MGEVRGQEHNITDHQKILQMKPWLVEGASLVQIDLD
jgi:hypothetical protein